MRCLTEQDYKNASETLDVEIAVIKAVAEVESNGAGFLQNGLPKILFEGHIFHKLTEGKYDIVEPTISYPKWTKKYYLGGEKEYIRFNIAKSLDQNAALRSTSWGKFQILGSNYKDCGYTSVNDYVYEMQLDEAHHLKAFINLLASWNIIVLLRYHKWASFAEKYNGADFWKNEYDKKLAAAYQKYKGK